MSADLSTSEHNGDWEKTIAGVVFASSGVDKAFKGGIAMAVTVKSISLWRNEVENQVGTLAHTLEPVTKAGGKLAGADGVSVSGRGSKGCD